MQMFGVSSNFWKKILKECLGMNMLLCYINNLFCGNLLWKLFEAIYVLTIKTT